MENQLKRRYNLKKIKKINTAKRVKIILEQDETLVSHGGGLLIDEFIHRLGLAQMIDSTVRVKERESGYRESEAVLGLAISMITGGVCLDNLVSLREEEEFKAFSGQIPMSGVPCKLGISDYRHVGL